MSDRSRVLLTDPDPTHRVRLTGPLALAGYHVVEVASGRALLEVIASELLDPGRAPMVVVVNVTVAQPEVTRIVRRLSQWGRSPPIVVIGRDRAWARDVGSGLGLVSVVSEFASAADIVDAIDRAFASIPMVALPTTAEGRARMESAR